MFQFISEFIKAAEEGRLFISPVTLDQIVYQTYHGHIIEHEVCGVSLEYDHPVADKKPVWWIFAREKREDKLRMPLTLSADRIGKDFFLSSEEADAALKKGAK